MEKKMTNIHPGYILRMELVEGRKLSISKIARLLDTTRSNMSNIINGHTSITPNMALKLAIVFGGTAKHFLNLQSNYDLLEAEKDFNENPPKIIRYDFL
ncbi:HigA family addiction module antitoxin [Flavobacterium sp. FlaQc-28]|uniref:HigA family addiction module antitoxin n=1 Tax=Flavobacterium sp. FlaQc-28 TaxID=3374178 RepID=UPI00375675A1